MAINIFEKYPGRSNPPSVDYPLGSIKNQTAPGAMDGTPLDQAWANDKEGFFQSILTARGIAANGEVDKVGGSQYYDALAADPTEVLRGMPTVATAAQVAAGTPGKMIDAKNLKAEFFPSASGIATLTGVDNKIVFSGIAAALKLEKGDVIQIEGAGAQNEKLRTIESLNAGGNEVVVNYEHCGSRGNGPLKLSDFAGTVTIKRIAKWHSAPLGLGQDWVNVLGRRVNNIYSVNSTGRSICFVAASSLVIGGYIRCFVDSNIVDNQTAGSGQIMSCTALVPPGRQYKVDCSDVLINNMELR